MTMKEFESRVGQKGQITLPAEMRHRLGIKPRDIVRIVPVKDGVKIERAESRLLKGFGAVTPHERPENWRAIREEVEEGIAEEVMQEG
jgi:AbrB family looped-hinge helix DNA binding protein